MRKETGTLQLQKKTFMVELATKNGPKLFSIPGNAKKFRDADAAAGIQVEVTKDKDNRIIGVVIPGKEIAVAIPAPGHGQRLNRHPRFSKASPRVIGEEFHNPYTFIKFEGQPQRGQPTQLTADELPQPENFERISGVLTLKVKTTSPLLTCNPIPTGTASGNPNHRIYDVLSIGNDVIVPATGVRGALRTLMTIVTSGTLGYADQTAFLTQGRDCNLGPASQTRLDQSLPGQVTLGRVVTPGSHYSDGTLELGETQPILLKDLESTFRGYDFDRARAPDAREIWLELDSKSRPISMSDRYVANKNCYRLRLSGRPVNSKKREALFRPLGTVISLPASYWSDYIGRNQFGARPELKAGDLVWMLPRQTTTGFQSIQSAEDIDSLHWARWGRKGQPLLSRIPQQFHPDSLAQDGLVDLVTDLFGQVPLADNPAAISFAGRIRPDNLVFAGARNACHQETLAPLMPPHPGCLAFYRDNSDSEKISDQDQLRGYKVYRTQQVSKTDKDVPWRYDSQPVYKKLLREPPNQNTNKTVQLLPAGQTGNLRISFRALSRKELALLVKVCQLPWRLGGGKPLGLGACSVEIVGAYDEFRRQTTWQAFFGQALLGQDSPDPILSGQVLKRCKIWQKSQEPVKRLRYPRAARQNSRGGHAWFQTYAQPKMANAKQGQPRPPGLKDVRIGGNLEQRLRNDGEQLDPHEPKIQAQILPHFNAEDALADVLYGYDLEIELHRGDQTKVVDLKPIPEPPPR